MRIDEFSDMGSETAGLSDAERVRFVCPGFDILSAALTIISGLVKVAFGQTSPSCSFVGAVPSASFGASVPSAAFVGKVAP